MSPRETSSGAPPSAVPGQPATMRILVWDVPTRLFHWALAASFAIAWLTAESERLRNLHLVAGYSLLLLIGFRLAWGLAGTRYARFRGFLRGPKAIGRYLRSLVSGQPEHHVGHNPAGALAIVLLLVLGLLTGLSGWAAYNEIAGPWRSDFLEELHEAVATGMLAVVLVHIAGIVVSSLVHRENLVGAMITGRKAGAPEEGISQARVSVALLLAMTLAGIWGIGLTTSPASLPGLELVAGSRSLSGARDGAAATAGLPAHFAGREQARDDRD